MKPKRILRALLLLAAASALAVITASAAGSYGLDWWTVDGGGGSSSIGDNYSLAGTIGQPDAGPSMYGDAYSLMGGFWPGAATVVTPPGSVNITGNAGIDGATLSYDDGGPQSATAAGSGDYVISVPFNWTGTVTPSKPGYSFNPTQRDYPVGVTEDIIGEDYIATLELPTINRFYPTANSTACRRPLVGVDLLLTGIVRTASGNFDPSKVTLKLDGLTVTSQAKIRVSLTHPASRATILYQPTADLTLATHQVQFIYPGASGPVTQIWSFDGADVGCSN